MSNNLLNDAYGQSTLDAINAANAHPLPTPPEQPPSQVWNTLTAAPRGIIAGGAQAAAFGFDTLKTFGDVVAGYTANTDPSLIGDPQAQAKTWQEGQQARNALASGAAYSSSIGDNLYGFTSSLAPNPATSNIAEQTIYGLTKGLTKIVGFSALGGPAVGAALAGTSEGEAASQDLKNQGVDLGTRTAVGAVTGAGTALGAIVPVAGSTIGRTIGLAAAAGPGAYVAQTAATKAILQNADYTKLADQYDPLDPVGLAVSTLVPAGFGALHYRAMAGSRAATPAQVPNAAAVRDLSQMGGAERQALPYNDPRLDAYASQVEQQNGLPAGLLNAVKNAGERSNSNQVSPTGAQGVMQFEPGTFAAFGQGDPKDPINSIDAGGKYFADLLQRYNGNLRAALTEYNGGVRQAQVVARGGEPTDPQTRAYLKRVDQYLGDQGATQALTGITPTPDQVDAARVLYNKQLLEDSSLGASDDIDAMAAHLTAFQRSIDQMSNGTRIDVGDLIQPDQIRQADALTDMIGRLDDAHSDLLSQISNVAEPGTVSQLRAQLDDLQANPPTLESVTSQLQPPRTTYEPTATRAAREQAEIARNAPAELQSQLEAHAAQIDRLQGQIEANRNAEVARQALPAVEQQRAALRAQRDAIGAPPSRLTDQAAAARQVFDEGPDVTPRVAVPEAGGNSTEKGSISSVSGRTTDEPPAGNSSNLAAEAQPSRGSGGDASGETAAPDYQPQFEAENSMLPVGTTTDPETGETRIVTLGETLAAARAEANAQKELAPLMRVAAQCFLANGD